MKPAIHENMNARFPRLTVKAGLGSPIIFGVGVGLVAFAWWNTQRSSLPTRPEPLPLPHMVAPKLTRVQVDTFYKKSVSPLLIAAKQRDRQAVARAVANLHGSFDLFRAGVPDFADDVSSWGTRAGVIKRLTQDQWTRWTDDPANAHEVADFVGRKIELHVLYEAKLSGALGGSLEELRSDLQASHNQLASEIKAAVQLPDCPAGLVLAGDWNATFRAVEVRAVNLASAKADNSLVAGVASFVGSAVATTAAEKALAPVVIESVVMPVMEAVAAQLATSGLVTAAAGGGAVATLGVGGGAVGSVGGPLGTVVVGGIGLAVGCVVDSFVTDHFKAKMTADCDRFLDGVERQIVNGQPNHPGLNQEMLDAVDRQDDALGTALLDDFYSKVP